MSGWRVPGYTELGELGAGAHGRVVLARHGDEGALVAIKYVGTGERTAPRVPSEREARIMASVRHPNVVRLHALVRGDTGVALVMEAVRGVSLNRLLRGLGALEPEAALAVLKGSLLGLAAAHDAGVVHRDYKPDNVIVGDGGVSKLIDFGVASVSGESSVAGTAAYMAPEQCNGDPAGPAADVYAATCVFVECVAGRPPYRGDRDAVLMAQHLHGPIPAELVPAPLRGLVAHGMAKSAAERPPGAAEFVAELEAVAVEEYGDDWERRGLIALAAAALALMPRGGPAQAGTSTADSTVGSGQALGAVPVPATPAAGSSAKDVVKDQARRSTRTGLLVLCAALLVLIGTSLYILRDHATTRHIAERNPPPPGTSAPERPSPTPSHPKKGGDGGSDGGGPREVAAKDHPGGPFDRPPERLGTPCPAYAIAPYSFGSVQVGQAVTRDFTFPRRTCDDVGAMSVRGPGAGGFGALVSCPPPGAECRFRVTFRPAERGRLYSASVVVPSTGGGTAVALRVSGTAATPVQTCPRQALPVRNLGSVEAGQTVSRVLDVPLNACYDTSAIRLDGDPSFALDGTRCGGAACQVTVTFSPTDAGARSATLVVPDRTGEAAVTVPVTAAGTRTVPSCKRGVNGPDYRFSRELEGDGRIKEPVPIPWDWCYDAGTISLTDTSAFRLVRTSCPPSEVSSCDALVSFEPGEPGTYVTTLVVRDRDGGPGVSVRVTATAVEERCDPDPDGCPSGVAVPPSEPSSGTPSEPPSTPPSDTPTSDTPTSVRAVPGVVRPEVSPGASDGGTKTVTPSAKPGPDAPKKPEQSEQPKKKEPEKKEPEKPDTPALPHPDPSTAPPSTGPTGSGRTRAVPAR
ncbi:protein kinase [Actinomadura syzygii]|uniref:Protein kinase n=1 Tax=Actinomadura syzygii TaxID=1427538 RepID=A0A5D0UGH3_9ACTN|nr:protein kinase [Actinomadura syzygii]TYC17611.1 protein kinase [Actinomadura syzygii]